MERSPNFDERLTENATHFSDQRAKEVLVTPAAIVYVISLICGGLGILSFFVFPHTLPVTIGCIGGLAVAIAGATFAIRSVIQGLRA